ncbi:cytochrome P450 [Hygrophoropsis aurantiaca]|uniref:Cytochrome P450 n=1 Tax=Hygrophoropsis aurantiaca TaxID=72124 RepID=A0ACB8A4F9_9AGAM|nr:cytochrome P450 [Hygrophoropsis aurantiaca]
MNRLSLLTQNLRITDIVATSCVIWILLKVSRPSPKVTRLRGPPRKSIIFGTDNVPKSIEEAVAISGSWCDEYGSIIRVPSVLGRSYIILNDAKAIAHFYAQARDIYVNSVLSKNILQNLVGKGLLWADGEDHKRQRKSLTPAFTSAAIRKLTSIFYDTAHKAKTEWDNKLLDCADGTVIEVQSWMSRISLDTIGIAGFSHDFGTLDGKPSTIADIIESFARMKFSSFATLCLLLSPVFPWIVKLPIGPTVSSRKLNAAMGSIAETLLSQSKEAGEDGVKPTSEDNSLISLLIRAGAMDEDSHKYLTKEEVIDQMKVLLFAGNATTSISLTWALIRLSQNLDIQTKLREELSQFPHGEPSMDQLNTLFPYLDAVVHEILRLDPPVVATARDSAVDDVIPLSEPVKTVSGEMVDHVLILKGTTVIVQIITVNRSEAFWGPDEKKFKPERWLTMDEFSEKATGIQGHRHLLTFIDGPRACLGKGFALTQLKAVLFVLIRNFIFELPGGPDTQAELTSGLLPRPRIVGEEGDRVPLKVRRVD